MHESPGQQYIEAEPKDL